MITKQQLEAIPHIANVEQLGNPAIMFTVTTETGYFIHLTIWDDDEALSNIYKTVTGIYPDDDINIIQIVAEADLPADADICGGVNPPSVTE